MKIYTKTGDKGKTSLFDGTRVSKNNNRVHTYGTVDELNSLLGVIVAHMSSSDKYQHMQNDLLGIQSDLLTIGAILANPSRTNDLSEKEQQYIDAKIENFEKRIDEMTEKLPELSKFVLPGGGKIGSLFHVARTVARRAERHIIMLSEIESINQVIIRYFNRLSDLLFTESRYSNYLDNVSEVIWEESI